MKTYRINGNSMTLGNEEVSDQFFGTETPSSYTTKEMRDGVFAQWIDLGWITPDDVVIWEDSATHPYISMSSGIIPDTSVETHLINQHGELVPITNEDSALRWAHWNNNRCDSPSYSGTTTFHCMKCGSIWDREDYIGGSVIRGAKCNC